MQEDLLVSLIEQELIEQHKPGKPGSISYCRRMCALGFRTRNPESCCSPGAVVNGKYQKQGLLVMVVNLSSEGHFFSYYDDLKDINVSNLF